MSIHSMRKCSNVTLLSVFQNMRDNTIGVVAIQLYGSAFLSVLLGPVELDLLCSHLGSCILSSIIVAFWLNSLKRLCHHYFYLSQKSTLFCVCFTRWLFYDLHPSVLL